MASAAIRTLGKLAAQRVSGSKPVVIRAMIIGIAAAY
jgi:hypothetical protein